MAAKVLIRDENGAVLLVNPNYKEFWDLPGGMAEANEAPRSAAQRELLEELGIELAVGRLLALDWNGPQGPWDDQLVFTFDGGVLVPEDQRRLQVSDPELSSFEFVAVDDVATRLRADVADRLVRALAAVGTAGASYWELGSVEDFGRRVRAFWSCSLLGEVALRAELSELSELSAKR